jgi:SpoVK/Ycf46/Vps4 family AAA+-type ATPase
VLLQLEWEDQRTIVAWSGGAASGSGCLEMSRELMLCLNLEPDLPIEVVPLEPHKAILIPAATRIFVEPWSVDDWEIFELQAKYIEDNMLNQIAVVTEGQKLPLWIGKHTFIHIKIGETSPAKTVRLVPDCEVVVIPKPRAISQPTAHDTNRTNVASKTSPKQQTPQTLRVQYIFSQKVQKSFHLKELVTDTEDSTKVFINQKLMKKFHWEDGDFVTLTPLVPKQAKHQNDRQHTPPNLPRKAFVCVFGTRNIVVNHIAIHRNVALMLQVEQFERVRIQLIDAKACKRVQDILLCPIGSLRSSMNNMNTILNALKEWKARKRMYHSIPVVNGQIISLIVESEHSLNDINQKTENRTETKSLEEKIFDGYNKMQSTNRTIQHFDFSLYCNVAATLKKLHDDRQSTRDSNSTDDSNFPSDWANWEYLQSLFGIPTSETASRRRNNNRTNDMNSEFERNMSRVQRTLNPEEQIQNELHRCLKNDELYILDKSFEFVSDRVKLGPAVILEQNEDVPDIDEIQNEKMDSIDDIEGMEEQCRLGKQHIINIFNRHLIKEQLGVSDVGHGGILIFGEHGSGKTLLAIALANGFKNHPQYLTYTTRIQCSELSGLRLDTIRTKITETFSRAVQNQPSIVIFDDLDVLAPNDQRETVIVGDPLRSRQIAEIIVSWMTAIQREIHSVVPIVTVQHTTALNPVLLKPHLFPTQLNIPPPSQEARAKIIRRLMMQRGLSLEFVDLQTVALNCEGYLGIDLAQLIERAVHVASLRFLEERRLHEQSNYTSHNSSPQTPHFSLSDKIRTPPPSSNKAFGGNGNSVYETKERLKNNSLTISNIHQMDRKIDNVETTASMNLITQDFIDAQKNYIPASLKGIKLYRSNVTWDDIGGLEDVKNVLKQTLEWPSKYSFLFKQLPLRHRSGILLYGPPGCGKTMLACAVASECQMNFIAVKGPELLNKYIGASEQSVRELFARATAAKPCVLFFDEFDAIAPIRGHDNTGVTDRVVNQLLTQLDGVEALEGVYVLAATSRPDLIDRALLRPGRLDKAIYVGIPTHAERVKVTFCETTLSHAILFK